MSVNSKTATAAIALMIAAGAYPIATIAQTQTQTESEAVEVQVIEEGAETTGEAVEQGASEAGEAIGQAAEETGEAVEQGAEAAAEGAESAGETIVEGAESAGEAVEQGVSEAGEAAEGATGTTVEVIEQGTDEAAGTAEATQPATEGATDSTAVIETDVAPAGADLDESQQQELEQAAAEGKPVPPTEMLMGVQQEGQWLSSELIDQEVRNPQGEVIGDIGAILFSDSGPDGVIVEVGGFLGIGEKDVAIKWSELAISQDGIMVNATEEQLKNAPDFLSMEEQQMEADLEAQQELTGEDQGMMSSGNTGVVGQEAPATDLQAEPQTGTTQTQ